MQGTSQFFTSNDLIREKFKRFKLWDPFVICLQNSTANPVAFAWIWTGLNSRQIANGSHDFYFFNFPGFPFTRSGNH